MKVAVIQLSSKLDYKYNLDVIREYLAEAKNQHCDVAFLPECFYSMSDGVNPTPYLVESGSVHESNIISLAVDSGISLLGGSVAYKCGDVIYNRAYNISASGDILSTYDKINLFACDFFKDGKKVKEIREANIYSAGNKTNVFDYKNIKIGNTICFDIRFPEIFALMIKESVDLITVPSAFTKKTGELHWHILNRARAIETQSFIVSPAQVGEHNSRISTYGHSLVVDPWGEVLLDLGGKKSSVGFVDLNFDKIISMRNSIKVR
jgi:deaminated glutathione amidase